MVKYEKVIKMLAPKFYSKWAIPKNNMTNNNCLKYDNDSEQLGSYQFEVFMNQNQVLGNENEETAIDV